MSAHDEFLKVEGHELLRPLKTVKGSDQMRLLGKLKSLGLVSEAGKKKTEAQISKSLDFEAVADLIDYVGEKFAHNQEEFEAFTMGGGGFERALNVVISYASIVGEGNGSGS